MRCSEPGGSVAVVIVASRALGGLGWPSSAYLGRNATRSLRIFRLSNFLWLRHPGRLRAPNPGVPGLEMIGYWCQPRYR